MKEKYRIYNYLKNHEGALIALVSGATGFVIMALNFVLYETDRFYLSKWNCSFVPIENSQSHFYSLCIWFVFFIVQLFLGKKLGMISLKYGNYLAKLNSSSLTLKKRKKDLDECENALRNIKKVNDRDVSFDIHEVSQQITMLKSEIHSIKSSISKMRLDIFFKRILGSLFLLVESLIPIALIKYIQTFEFIQSLKSTLYATGLLLVFLIIINLLMVFTSKKNILEPSDVKFFSKDSLSDLMIVRNCKNAVGIFVFVVFLIILNSTLESLTKKKFEIFSIEKEKYASIYESEHYLIGEKISYNDSIITFYVNDQVVVEKTNLSIVKKKFEKVEKIDSLMTTLTK